MSACPNCGYELVLLSSRPKYKCALCSKLYPQIEIDNREFRRRDKIQKKLDIQNLKREFEEEWTSLKELKKSVKLLFSNFPKSKREYCKEYYEKNRKKILARNKEWRKKHSDYEKKRHQKYYQKNKAIVKFKARQYELKNKEKVRERKKKYRLLKLEYFKALDRERYERNRNKIRQQQNMRNRMKKVLADMFSENSKEEPSQFIFYEPNAHFGLCELLSEKLTL